MEAKEVSARSQLSGLLWLASFWDKQGCGTPRGGWRMSLRFREICEKRVESEMDGGRWEIAEVALS